MNTSVSKNSATLDFIGISLSVLCAIHCSMTPLILLFLPSLGSFFKSEYMHLILFVLILPTAIFSFLRCYKLHKDKKVLALGASALLFLLGGLTAEKLFHSHSLEHTLSIIGSCIIIVAHGLNIRHCHCINKKSSCSHK
jgi:hypothetical protein